MSVVTNCFLYSGRYQDATNPEKPTLCVMRGDLLETRHHTLTGESALLMVAHWDGVAPFGILLDRLQEYPYEAGDEQDALEAVIWFRLHCPEGVWK